MFTEATLIVAMYWMLVLTFGAMPLPLSCTLKVNVASGVPLTAGG